MNSPVYNDMVNLMDQGEYTEVTAKQAISKLFAYKQLTENEYEELMEKANSLSANTPSGEIETRIYTLEQNYKTLSEDIAAIKKIISEGGTTVPEPEPGATGEEFDPIEAARGMTYYKDKYYKDPEDGQIYQCFRDSDSEPGTGVALNYLPHELVNIYFYFTRVS